MATIHVAFGGMMGGGAPVFAPKPSSSAVLTSSVSSTATTISAVGGDYVSVTAVTGPGYVVIGRTPVAAGAGGYCVPTGVTKEFGPLREGDKVAVIDV